MFKNYFKTAWRNLVKNKMHSFINIAGLSVGMAVAILIGLWIWDEVSFNSSFANHKKLAQVMVTQTLNNESGTDESCAIPPAAALRANYAADIKYVSLVSGEENHLLAVGEKKLSVAGKWVEPDFPEMFTLKMLEGNRNALQDPSSIVLSQSMAKAFFGDKNALNQVLKIDNKLEMKVAGVYEDLPRNTEFYPVKFLLPWSNKNNWAAKQTNWGNHCALIYVQLTANADFNNTIARIKNLPTPHINEWKEELVLQPADKMHLYTEFKNGKATGGRIQFVWLFGIIGVFVLLLACINFMNLSTARSEKRAKEVGIRKTMGSLRGQLIGQFLSESLLVVFIAFIFSLLMVQLSLPFFNTLADKQMSVPWSNSLFWILALGFALFTGIVSGSYPAFYLSAFDPIKVLKGVFRTGRFASLPRKVLVVTQFTVSITLIVGTIIVFRQIQYAKDRPVGYAREGLITIPLNLNAWDHRDAFRNDLLQTGSVANMAVSSQAASNFNNNNSLDWSGRDANLIVFFRDVNVTHEFGKTVGWTIAQGRDFSRDFASDSTAAILSESAVKAMGLKNPIGQIVRYNGEKNFTVVGIVKDMVTQSPYDPMQPSVFFCSGWMSVVTIRMKAGTPVNEALAKIAAVFKKYGADTPFEYKFVDDVYARKFSNEVRIGNLASVFAILAIFISCLGLFGLASFVAEQRTKEIGVRKVLGATVFILWKMLSKDFALLILASCAIAIPLAWYFLNQWLQNYTYHTQISWWIFAATIAGALAITILTVSFQAIKAAIANPIKSLRSE
jgi:putative ABC transport system permease protein